jgi:hypothetical protein
MVKFCRNWNNPHRHGSSYYLIRFFTLPNFGHFYPHCISFIFPFCVFKSYKYKSDQQSVICECGFPLVFLSIAQIYWLLKIFEREKDSANYTCYSCLYTVLMIPTPDLSHLNSSDFRNIYEPSGKEHRKRLG